MALLVNSEAEAEDVVQDTFVQAFLKLDTFRHGSSFYTWLYRIAYNTSVSRRRKKRPVLSMDLSMDGNREVYSAEPLDEGDRPGENLERQEQATKINTALKKLSDEHRRILVLREIEGFCYETISESLGLAIGTVRSRLHRARLQLKSELEKLE